MMMIFGIIIVMALLWLALGALKKQNNQRERNPIKGKRILTMNEQPTFLRLKEALPENIVLAQVAFSAFMTAKGYATRNLFNRKIADFVVLDQHFNIVAIVELDDSSHQGNEAKDESRDALIAESGYEVIRYNLTPYIQHIKSYFSIFKNQ